ncbi:MAG: 5-formyltetrahydrofolate cyclo-ligase [Nanoarchaeota archaeon]|nr:5-formyltetrahydrofolate cyclo-ligase [Nanoarchaeota archaeon]MBU1704861.1 5-formyltetrahydrofolate cyclo-ligase [Nanoarchaeota archaeon]
MKHSLREKVRNQRNNLSKEFVRSNSQIIKQKLFQTKEYQKAKSVLFYVSFGNEVNTLEMIKEALAEKIVAVPIVQENDIVASVIKDIKELDSANKFGIKEPSFINSIEKIDLVIVPGLAFDRQGYRLGFGKGYYDKFLSKLSTKTIGICFDFQILDKLPAEEHDIRIDKIITEKQTITF